MMTMILIIKKEINHKKEKKDVGTLKEKVLYDPLPVNNKIILKRG